MWVTLMLEEKIIDLNSYHKNIKLKLFALRFPFKYKRNAIISELQRAMRIALDFDKEIKRIKNKYIDTGYPKYVIENTIKNFNTKNVELIIPLWLFNKRKRSTIRLPF